MRRFWSAEEDAVLRADYPGTATAALAARLGRSVRALRQRAGVLGLRKSAAYRRERGALVAQRGKATRFRPGGTPWNAGKAGYDAGGRSRQTRFRPGNRPAAWVPVGSETTTPDGYRKRKIADGRQPSRRNWALLHVLNWEAAHGPVAPGHCIIFIDGDKANCAIENLACVSRRELAMINKRGFADLPPALRPSAIALARLEVSAARARQEKNAKAKTGSDPVFPSRTLTAIRENCARENRPG